MGPTSAPRGGGTPRLLRAPPPPGAPSSAVPTRGPGLGREGGGEDANTRLHHSGIEVWDQKGLVCLGAHLPCVVNQQPGGVVKILGPFGTNGGNPVGLFERGNITKKTLPVEVEIWTGITGPGMSIKLCNRHRESNVSRPKFG